MMTPDGSEGSIVLPSGGATGTGAEAGGGVGCGRLAGGRGAQDNPASASTPSIPMRTARRQKARCGEWRGGMIL